MSAVLFLFRGDLPAHLSCVWSLDLGGRLTLQPGLSQLRRFHLCALGWRNLCPFERKMLGPRIDKYGVDGKLDVSMSFKASLTGLVGICLPQRQIVRLLYRSHVRPAAFCHSSFTKYTAKFEALRRQSHTPPHSTPVCW